MLFIHRHADGQTIACACRGKHDFVYAALNHGIQQPDSIDHIVSKIFPGFCHRLANIGIGSEVHDRIDLIFVKCLLQQISVGKVAFHQRAPLHCPTMTIFEIIECNRCISSPGQRLARMTPNISSTASYKYVHKSLMFMSFNHMGNYSLFQKISSTACP